MVISDWYDMPGHMHAGGYYYIFSDIHGCSKTLLRLLDHMPAKAQPIFLGDAVDRGPDSVGVISILVRLIHERNCLICHGNHDALCWFANRKGGDKGLCSESYMIWRANGSSVTLKSFQEAVDEPKSELLRNAPRIFEDLWLAGTNYIFSDDVLFIHAGVPQLVHYDFLQMPAEKAVLEDDSPYWWRPSVEADLYITPRYYNGKPIFVINGHSIMVEAYRKFPYGLFIDIGYEQKRAVELDFDRYRFIDVPCNSE